MAKKKQRGNDKPEKVFYKKPILKKEGSLRDITAGSAGGSIMLSNPKRKAKKW